MREGIESLNTDGDMRILKAARRYDTRYSPQDAVVLSSCACRASLLIVLTRPPPPSAQRWAFTQQKLNPRPPTGHKRQPKPTASPLYWYNTCRNSVAATGVSSSPAQ